MKPSILLQSGNYFNFEDPQSNVFSIDDIAHGLSNTCRFAGQCNRFYSVAQHAVIVSYLVPPEFAYEALHHDDSEAFYGDITSPFKQILFKYCPDLKQLFKSIDAVVHPFVGIPLEISEPVHHADLIALATERRDIMSVDDGSVNWDIIKDIRPAPVFIQPVSPVEAKAKYLSRHLQLLQQRELLYVNP